MSRLTVIPIERIKSLNNLKRRQHFPVKYPFACIKIIYTPTYKREKLDIYLPEAVSEGNWGLVVALGSQLGALPWPTRPLFCPTAMPFLVFFHGGYWQSGRWATECEWMEKRGDSSLPGLFLSWDCCNKVWQIEWFYATTIYSLTDLETGSPKSENQ